MKKYVLLLTLLIVLILSACNISRQNNLDETQFNDKELIDINALKLENSELVSAIIESEDKISMLEEKLLSVEAKNLGLQDDLLESEVKIVSLEEQLLNSNSEIEFEHMQLKIFRATENRIWYMLDESTDFVQSMHIIESNSEDIIEPFNEITLHGFGSGDLFKVQVIGSIYDFQLVSLEWDEDLDELVEIDILEEIPEVRNEVVIINTLLPCGIPSEKISWKDNDGNEYEVLLGNNGIGYNGEIILNN